MPKSPQTPPTFIDIFAGCGGLSYGLMKAGWNGLFAIERDTHAFASLSENLIQQNATTRFSWPKWLPKEPHAVDDVLSSHGDSLLGMRNQVDLLAGGPPCQGFSSAGRRMANDPRNHLTSAYLDFVALVQPRIVLIENVKGIAVDFDDKESADGKVNYAKKIIQSLATEYNVSAEILDTSTFGVPQKRKRFFIIGLRKDAKFHRNETPFAAIERLRLGFLAKRGLTVPVEAKNALSDMEVRRNGTRQSKDSAAFQEIAYKGPLTSYQRLMNEGVGKQVTDTRLARHNSDITSRFEKIIQHCHAEGRLNVSISPELRASFGLKKCAIRVLDPNGPSPTITSMPDDLIHYSEPRTLTVRENARLQSFPDSFVFRGKYTTGGDRRKKEVPRYTQVANAVPPLVAEAIGQALMQYVRTGTINSSPSASHKDSRYSHGAAEVGA